MKPAPNTYELPKSMKRVEVRVVSPAAPEPMRCAPALLLAVSCAFLMLFAFAFDPYPEFMEPGVFRSLARHSPLFFIPAVFGWLLAVAFSALAVVMRWSRFRNVLVLLLCFFAPFIALLLGSGVRALVAGGAAL